MDAVDSNFIHIRKMESNSKRMTVKLHVYRYSIAISIIIPKRIKFTTQQTIVGWIECEGGKPFRVVVTSDEENEEK